MKPKLKKIRETRDTRVTRESSLKEEVRKQECLSLISKHLTSKRCLKKAKTISNIRTLKTKVSTGGKAPMIKQLALSTSWPQFLVSSSTD